MSAVSLSSDEEDDNEEVMEEERMWRDPSAHKLCGCWEVDEGRSSAEGDHTGWLTIVHHPRFYNIDTFYSLPNARSIVSRTP